ncbi:hypothetical protein D770_15865 [Flammeovirgaceae bacterium 311]|nr:hypothetical protein D770_15865 [Flammeovirgaceae bacterium 311]
MQKLYKHDKVPGCAVARCLQCWLRIGAICLLLLIAGPLTLYAQIGKIPKGFTPIFNGKDLRGWHISKISHHGTVGNFFVEDGILFMKQYPYGQGGIILTDKKYKDFELYLEFKGDPGTNGGIFFRSNESGSAYQLEVSGDGEPGTGNLIGEMLRTTTPAQAKELAKVWNKGGWNSFRLRVVGAKPHATLWVNGVQMWEVKAQRNDLIADVTEGMIALQLHWSSTLLPVPGGSCCGYSWRPDGAHAYRNIAIKEL